MADLSTLSDEELEKGLQDISAEQDEAHKEFKARRREYADEIEHRNAAAKVAKLVSNLSPEELRLLKQVKASDLGPDTVAADDQTVEA